MPKLILRYPDGLFGVALLLLRLSYAAIATPALMHLWQASALTVPIGINAAVIAVSLVAGLGARIAIALLAGALAWSGATAGGELAWYLIACTGGAVASLLLGPGAYSIDAHLYGRRVIRLDPRSPDRGGPD